MIRLAISADGHVTEPLDLWTTRLPAGMRARGPRLEVREGRSCFVVENRVIRKLPPRPDAGADRREAGGGAGFWSEDDPAEGGS